MKYYSFNHNYGRKGEKFWTNCVRVHTYTHAHMQTHTHTHIYRVSQNRCNPLIWLFILNQVIFHLSLKKQTHHFRKVKPDDKGRNWLILSNSARERPSSWDFFGLLPTESLTASTLWGHLAVNFLSDLGFSASLSSFFFYWPHGWKFVYPMINLALLGIILKVMKFLLAQCWMILSPNKWRNLFSSLFQGIVIED